MFVMLVNLSVQLNYTSHSNTIFTIATGTRGFEKNQEQDTMCPHIGTLPCSLPAGFSN